MSPKLSICIATFNREAFIGATLESILTQTTDACEVVVLDGASTDGTERVVLEYARRFSHLRYIRQDVNGGVDCDYDRVIELARGEYCWLMTDDDLLKPGAVATVLKALRLDVSLIIVNADGWDLSMSNVLQPRWFNVESDRTYEVGEMDRLFVEVGAMLTYIGCFVIQREIWLARDRKRYFDSWFIHVGVIFQERLPGKTLLIADPLISYRMGNTHTFSAKAVEVMWVKWPSVIWSLPLSEPTKNKVCSEEPWRSPAQLLLWRALGFYSLTVYQQWIRPRLRSTHFTATPALVALLPGVIVNGLCVLYFLLGVSQRRGVWLQAMKESRFYLGNWKVFKRLASLSHR